MPSRRSSSLSGGSRAPIRGLTGLLRELDPATRDRLVSAFADAEDLIDFHQRGTAERQTRRRRTGRIQQITLVGESNLLGGFLSWNRVNDPRVQFYEVQLSNDSAFSNPQTIQVIESFLALENIRTVRFARVRAVTSRGDVGLFSNTVRLRPKISAPNAFSVQFYPIYEDNSDPTVTKTLEYSGGLSKIPEFYSVLSTDFYADRIVGGVSIWGYISSRLRDFRDGENTVWDRVRFNVNGITHMDSYWPMSVLPYDAEDFHVNQRDSSGNLMTFYGKDGYTSSFGPYAVSLPTTIQGSGPLDAREVFTFETGPDTFYWDDPDNARRASRFDEGQLSSLDDDAPHHEASSRAILGVGATTEYLAWRNFEIDIADDDVPSGIEVQIKRRQLSPFNDPISQDSGFGIPNRPITVFFVSPNTSPTINNSDILVDVDTGGRYVRGGDDPLDTLRTDPDSDLGVDPDTFTLIFWMLNEQLLIDGGVGDREEILGLQGDGAELFFRRETEGTTGSDRLTVILNSDGPGQSIAQFEDVFNTNNTFIMVGFVYNNGQGTLYIDGAARAPTTGNLSSSGQFNATQLQLFNNTGQQGNAFQGGLTQIALFNAFFNSADMINIGRRRELGQVDYRLNRFSEDHSKDLIHYWLFIPGQAEIKDHTVVLFDESGPRTDLENKALSDESWPRLSDFFYTDLRQFGVLPLGVAGGVPHDNHTAIGYQKYGGLGDLWGGSFSAQDVKSFYFGFGIRAQNTSTDFAGSGYIDNARLLIYTQPKLARTVNVGVDVSAASHFYENRQIFGGVMNIIELGERLADLPDC